MKQKMSPTALTLLGIALTLFGVIFIGFGLRQRSQISQLLANGAQTSGRYIGAETRRTAGAETYARYGVVEFVASDGKAYTVESTVSWAGGTPTSGSTVPVIYDPADPATARINTFAETQLVWTLLVAIGILVPLGFFTALALTR
jgi:hypothetical protein